MNRDDEKKSSSDQQQQKPTATDNSNHNRNEDNEEHSYPGKLDQVEGSMHNGEIGGGIRKEEE